MPPAGFSTPSSRNLLAACTPVVLVTYQERAGSVGRLPWSATLAASSNRVQAIRQEDQMSVREKILGAESRWLMGRVMAGDFLEGVGKYLHLVAPKREEELTAAIQARAALARRRPVPVRGARNRRSPGRLFRQDRAAIHRPAGIRLTA
jgi:hypothetical protein